MDWALTEDRAACRDLFIPICKTFGALCLALAIENHFHNPFRTEDFDPWSNTDGDLQDAIKAVWFEGRFCQLSV